MMVLVLMIRMVLAQVVARQCRSHYQLQRNMQIAQPFSLSDDDVWFVRSMSNSLCRLRVNDNSFDFERYLLPFSKLLILGPPASYDVALCALNQQFLFVGPLGVKLGSGPPNALQTTNLDWPFPDLRPTSGIGVGSAFMLVCVKSDSHTIN